jgi:hypothetical protein
MAHFVAIDCSNGKDAQSRLTSRQFLDNLIDCPVTTSGDHAIRFLLNRFTCQTRSIACGFRQLKLDLPVCLL